MTCTAEDGQSLEWSIDLPRFNITGFQFGSGPHIETLNNHGLYKVRSEEELVLQLYINETTGNNGTVIRCQDLNSGMTILSTNLVVYGKCDYTIFQALVPSPLSRPESNLTSHLFASSVD